MSNLVRVFLFFWDLLDCTIYLWIRNFCNVVHFISCISRSSLTWENWFSNRSTFSCLYLVFNSPLSLRNWLLRWIICIIYMCFALHLKWIIIVCLWIDRSFNVWFHKAIVLIIISLSVLIKCHKIEFLKWCFIRFIYSFEVCICSLLNSLELLYFTQIHL